MVNSATTTFIQQYTDGEVIESILSGNTAMFEVLIRRCNPLLYKVGRSYGFNHQDTEDLMQESFVNAYINLRQFAGQASFKTWLIKIMLHQCYHKAHKHSYQKEHAAAVLPDNSTFMFSSSNHSDNERSVNNKELNSVIEACLQRLPEDYRTTFVLRELTGFSVAETADILHITVSNVKVRLNRAKVILRREIAKTYTPEDIFEFNLVYCDRVVNAVMARIQQLSID